MPKPPLVPPETKAAFIAAVIGAKIKVFGSAEACPFTVNANILDGVHGPEFQVVIREDTPMTTERLAEIISCHAPITFLALVAVLETLVNLRIDAERREKEGDGDSLVPG